jgi:AbrB family looped-hinge helix DNA binding protein
MIIELRKKSQITIPKEIVEALSLQEGDHLDININQGVIQIEPVAVYSKKYVDRLEKTVMKIQEDPSKYTAGPFTTLEDMIKYLENEDEEIDQSDDEKK